MARWSHRGLLVAVLLAAACGPDAGPRPPTGPAPPPAGGEHAVSFAFANELGAAFRLVRLEVAVDGRLLFVRAAETLADEREILLAGDLPLAAGEHTITLHAGLRGDGKGVFSYLREYRFTVRSSHRFQARPGLVVTVHLHERFDVPIDQRPAVRFEEGVRQ